MEKLYPLELMPEGSLLATAQGRQRLLTTVLRLTKGTPLEPQAYEQQLLGQFVRGDLTIDQVLAILAAQAEQA